MSESAAPLHDSYGTDLSSPQAERGADTKIVFYIDAQVVPRGTDIMIVTMQKYHLYSFRSVCTHNRFQAHDVKREDHGAQLQADCLRYIYQSYRYIDRYCAIDN